jgi:hypothetical protein
MKRCLLFVFLTFCFNFLSAQDDLKNTYVGVISMYADHSVIEKFPIHVSVQATPSQPLPRPTSPQLHAAAQYYQQRKTVYGVCPNSYQNIMKLGRDDFVSKVIYNKNLSSSEKYHLWNDYKAACSRQKSQKFKDFCTHVEHILQACVRDELRQTQQLNHASQAVAPALTKPIIISPQQQQHTAWIKQQHEELANLWFYDDLPANLRQARKAALQQTRIQDYTAYEQIYRLTPAVQGFLNSKSIDYHAYELYFGTALQQQFHTEICGVVQDLADHALKHEASRFFEHAWNFVQATLQANIHHCIPGAAALSWAAQLLEISGTDILQRPNVYAQAVVLGVVDCAVDCVHMLRHPLDTIADVAKIIAYVLHTYAVLMPSDAELAFACVDPELQALREQKIAELDNGVQALMHHLQGMDGPERVRALTKFGADFCIPGKIMHACGQILAVGASQARGIRTMSGCMGMLAEEYGVQGAIGELMHDTQQLQVAVEQGIAQETATQFMQTERHLLSPKPFIPRSIRAILKDVKSFGGVIPFDKIELKYELEAALKALQESLHPKDLPALRKQFGRRVVTKNGVKCDINMTVNHALNFEFKLVKKSELQGYKLHLSGGHRAGTCKLLEQKGLVIIEKTKKLANGCTEFTMRNAFTNEPMIKTEFPPSWTDHKILQSGWQVYDYGLEKIDEAGMITRQLIIDQIKISIVLSPRNEVCVNIPTIVPYLINKS